MSPQIFAFYRFYEALKDQLSSQKQLSQEMPNKHKGESSRSKKKKGATTQNRSTQTATAMAGTASVKEMIGHRIDEILSLSQEEDDSFEGESVNAPCVQSNATRYKPVEYGITDDSLSYLGGFLAMLDVSEGNT